MDTRAACPPARTGPDHHDRGVQSDGAHNANNIAQPRESASVRPSQLRSPHREEIFAALAKYHAANPRVFGSAAREDDRTGSDFDLLVDFNDEASLLDEVGLRLALTDILGVPVDVVAADTLRGAFRRRVLNEAVPL